MTTAPSPAAAVVCIVQRRLTHYRVPLFDRMRELLHDRGIDLRVLHGDATATERTKNDAGELPWATRLETTYLGGDRICWQPFAAATRGSDLVVLPQENRLVLNVVELLRPRRKRRLAFWGHGANLQSGGRRRWRERVKRWTTRRVDWWFAYTNHSAALIRAAGFDADAITVVHNSIDTRTLADAVARAGARPRAELRAALGVAAAAPLGLYVGSLYADKRIDRLLTAADRIGDTIPDFQLVIAGDGPLRAAVEAAARQQPHRVRYVGSVRGDVKAQWLAAADVMLHPGAIGLAVLDAFVAGLPLVTTDCGTHGPEFAYLQHGVNAVVSDDDDRAFAAAVAGMLRDDAARSRLAQAARAAAAAYSIEAMATRFVDGIERCLARGGLALGTASEHAGR